MKCELPNIKTNTCHFIISKSLTFYNFMLNDSDYNQREKIKCQTNQNSFMH